MLAGDGSAHSISFGMMRAWDVGHGHARDRRIEVEEGFVGDDRGDFRAEAAGAQILMDDQAAARSANAVEHHVSCPTASGCAGR